MKTINIIKLIVLICVAFMLVAFILEWNDKINIGYWMIFSPILVVLGLLGVATLAWVIFFLIMNFKEWKIKYTVLLKSLLLTVNMMNIIYLIIKENQCNLII